MPETDFGYRRVDADEKARLVGEVFSSVASRYDLMNDLMSFGIHRLWKRYAAFIANVRSGDRVLDLAGGTGDLTRLLAQRTGTSGTVILSDINADMLRRGRDRLLDTGLCANMPVLQLDAEQLPFADGCFNVVSIAFGLRNLTDKVRALAEIHRVLRPGGAVLVLEFSTPTSPLVKTIYDAYSFKLLPLLGKLVASDAASYRYLAESIRKHPAQDELSALLESVDFAQVSCLNVSGGIVALHRGFRV